MTTPDPRDPTERRRRLARRAFTIGIILGAVCGSLPEHYRAACRAIADICTGHVLP